MIPLEHTRYPSAAKFIFGQQVLVHQSGGMFCDSDDGDKWKTIPHDCSKPERHCESWIVGWNEFQGHPVIATRVYDNPCHVDWAYFERSLHLLDGEDWALAARYKIGDDLGFRW